MKKYCFTILAVFGALLLRAQDEGAMDETMEEINESWYASPWLWVGGAALIIILLVVLSRGKENKS